VESLGWKVTRVSASSGKLTVSARLPFRNSAVMAEINGPSLA